MQMPMPQKSIKKWEDLGAKKPQLKRRVANANKMYTRDGKEWKGSMHRMPNGAMHSGKTHSKTSRPLYKMKDLSRTVQNKIRQRGKS